MAGKYYTGEQKYYTVKRKGDVIIVSTHDSKKGNETKFTMTIEEISEALKKSYNKDFALMVFVKEKELSAVYEWAVNTPNEQLKQARLKWLNDCQYEFLPWRQRIIDAVCRNIKNKCPELFK